MDGIAKLLDAARNGRLVIFAGAGASMAPPTNLPSWRDVNRIVVRSLAAAAVPSIGEAHAAQAAESILTRHQHEKLPPEYQAQLLAETLGARYFEVLRNLDSEYPNANHLAIAWLARLGCVRAIITTNFDRVLEAAFAAVDAPLESHFHPEHFVKLAADLGRFDQPGGPCQLLKVHGSVGDPGTLIDTLAQRKKGFPAPLMDCVRHLLHSRYWLFLGFSGLDLQADPNYLHFSQESGEARGFSWMVRANTQPLPAVQRLAERYGDRAEFGYGDLPDWLLDFASEISPEPRPWIDQYTQSHPGLPAGASTECLDRNARAWASALPSPVSALCLGILSSACAEPKLAVELVGEILRKLEDQTAPSERGFALMKANASNWLGILLAAQARHQEAAEWMLRAVEDAESAGDLDLRDRCMGNLAVSAEALGLVEEATRGYEAALEGYRSRNDPATVAFGLNCLTAHYIRQIRLDEARALAEEAVICAKKAGDERQRGTALGHLGMIAKSKGEYLEALKILQEVEELFGRLGNDDSVAAAAGNRGEVLAAMGRFDEAETLQRSILETEERLGRRDNQAATCLSLGLLNQRRGDSQAAEHWYALAQSISHDLKDPANEGFALYRMAGLMIQTGRFTEALQLVQAALPLVSERNPSTTADLWALAGMANLHLNRPNESEEAYRNARDLFQRLKLVHAEAAAAMNLGTALMQQQRDREAAEAFAEAAEIWKQLGNQENLDYCQRAEAAVRLDERIANLSNAAHAIRDREQQLAEVREILALYPELVERYEKLRSFLLAAAFCLSAATVARFAGDAAGTINWYLHAAKLFQDLGRLAQMRDALTRAEPLLREVSNDFIRAQDLPSAIRVMLQAADVYRLLGQFEQCSAVLLNSAIAVAQSSLNFADARQLAVQAAEVVEPGSGHFVKAQGFITFCDSELSRG